MVSIQRLSKKKSPRGGLKGAPLRLFDKKLVVVIGGLEPPTSAL
jgi:hypothetical protein